MHIVDRPAVGELNGLVNGPAYHAARRDARSVDWSTPGLRVTRLRLLSDPGLPFWDVSYCHGYLNGLPVDVDLPFSQLPKRGFKRAIVAAAKAEGIYAHGLGILSNISTLC
jgi:hypothetical protein